MLFLTHDGEADTAAEQVLPCLYRIACPSDMQSIHPHAGFFPACCPADLVYASPTPTHPAESVHFPGCDVGETIPDGWKNGSLPCREAGQVEMLMDVPAGAEYPATANCCVGSLFDNSRATGAECDADPEPGVMCMPIGVMPWWAGTVGDRSPIWKPASLTSVA